MSLIMHIWKLPKPMLTWWEPIAYLQLGHRRSYRGYSWCSGWRSDQQIHQPHRLQVCAVRIWCQSVFFSFWAEPIRRLINFLGHVPRFIHLGTQVAHRYLCFCWIENDLLQAELLISLVMLLNSQHLQLLLILEAFASAFGFAPLESSSTFQLQLALLLLQRRVFIVLLQPLLFYFLLFLFLLYVPLLLIILFPSGLALLGFHSTLSLRQPLLRLWCSHH